MKFKLWFCLLIVQIELYTCFLEPISGYLGYAAVSGIAYYAYKERCNYFQCCQFKNKESFERELSIKLNSRIFGQPIVKKILPAAIHAHLNKEYPSSPLIISLHGWTGSGKTYTSQLVAETMFESGLNSIYVKKITPSTSFPNSNRINEYKEILINLLEDQAKLCKYSLFIIEEIDKLDPILIDLLTSYLNNYNPRINHLTFIFTSNVGSNKIVEKTFEYYENGKNREEIELHEFEALLKNQAYNDETTMKYSSLITSHLISHYIPFLPLERDHIKKCILYYIFKLRLKGYQFSLKNEEDMKDFVFKSIEWWPTDLKLYSNSGCKQVANKIDVAMKLIK